MYLLDTCVFIYYLEGSQKLSEKVKMIFENNNYLFLSQVSLWEIAIKKTTNKLIIDQTTHDLEITCRKGGIEIIPIKNHYFDIIQELPYIHSDPFDRLIIATAMDESLTLITSDKRIFQYPDINVIW